MADTPATRLSAAQRQVAMLQELTARREALQTRLTRTEVQAENAKRLVDEARAESLEKFGTDDVPTIRQKYSAAVAENDQRLTAFQNSLTETETALQDVERHSGTGDASSVARA